MNSWSLALDSLLTWNGLCLFCLLTFWTRPPWPAERGKIKYRPPPLGDGYIERLPLTADPINHPPSETLWSPQPPLPSSTTTLQLLCKTTEQSLQRFDRKIQGLSSKVRLFYWAYRVDSHSLPWWITFPAPCWIRTSLLKLKCYYLPSLSMLNLFGN